MPNWYEQPRWQPRLAVETDIMSDRFPGLKVRRLEDGTLCWVGELEPVPGVPCRVLITYPATYPFVEPKLDILDPPLEADTPHRYSDGSICVHKHSWDPELGTAVSVVPLLAAWWVAYVRWVNTGERF